MDVYCRVRLWAICRRTVIIEVMKVVVLGARHELSLKVARRPPALRKRAWGYVT